MAKRKLNDDDVDYELIEMEISRSQAATLFQISPARVSQLEKEGHLDAKPNGKFVLREIISQYRDYIQNNRGTAGRRY